MVPKPTKPTRAMAKPSSIPVKNRAISAPRPMTPTSTSLILAAKYLHDVGDHDQALHQAGGPHAEGDGKEGHAERGGRGPPPPLPARRCPRWAGPGCAAPRRQWSAA